MTKRAVRRAAAAGALILAVAAVALLVLSSGPRYTLRADFQDASGLVTGDLVQIGPAKVGTIDSIGLSPRGAAEVTMSLDPAVAPLHQGTIARIYEDSLSGIASKYVELEPGSSSGPAISGHGLIGETHTYSLVGLDEVFDALDSRTRTGLSQFIRGEAASRQNRGAEANQALRYLAPGLESTSQVTAELARDQPRFDQLIVDGATAMQALASKSDQLSSLITNTATATDAIARRSHALQAALSLFGPRCAGRAPPSPGCGRHSTGWIRWSPRPSPRCGGCPSSPPACTA